MRINGNRPQEAPEDRKRRQGGPRSPQETPEGRNRRHGRGSRRLRKVENVGRGKVLEVSAPRRSKRPKSSKRLRTNPKPRTEI